jgi:hypothetical protein
VDYVRSFGCRDDEITRLGVDSVSWCARFTAASFPRNTLLANSDTLARAPEMLTRASLDAIRAQSRFSGSWLVHRRACSRFVKSLERGVF